MHTPFDSLVEQRPPDDDTLFKAIADAIREKGYFYQPAVLPIPVQQALLNRQEQHSQHHYHRAAVGRGREEATNRFVRRDKILWFDQAEESTWQLWAQALQRYLNRHLLLGLFSFESHFAQYQKGDFYKKHYDAFKGQANRVLSLVTYLNPGWLPDQGGELVIYQPGDGGELIRITPELGTLVIFLSEEFAHEVLPAKRTRLSVAGWFRMNTSCSERVDPPS